MGTSVKIKSINQYLLSVQTDIYDKYKYLREVKDIVLLQDIKNAYLDGYSIQIDHLRRFKLTKVKKLKKERQFYTFLFNKFTLNYT